MEKNEQKVVSVAEVKSAIDAGVRDKVIIDVHSQEEFDRRHIPGSILIPLDDIIEKDDELVAEYPGKELYLFCRSGTHSAYAVSELESKGCANCKSVDGGIIAWGREGYPTEGN